MARKKSGEPERQEQPQVDPGTGARLLQVVIERGQALLGGRPGRPLQSDTYSAWELTTRNHLEKAFGRNSPNVSAVMDAGWLGIIPDMGEEGWEQHRAETLQTQLSRLDALLELLKTDEQLAIGSSVSAPVERERRGHDVFLVHGHNEGLREQIARFLEKLGQKVRILHEQPNEGKTLIEKFEKFADVAFAVVLLTPDDLGGPASAQPSEQHLRARQNVIFELGYFIGRLGRNRVCALYLPGVELPSDYQGVAYIPVDEGGAWRLEVARELKAALLPVDLNLAF